MKDKHVITIDFLMKKGFVVYKVGDKKIISYIKDNMIFEFGASNIPVLRKKIDDENSKYLAGVKHWEDVEEYWEPEPLTQEEICHYFYYIGAADGIAKSISKEGGKPDFEKRYKEFLSKLPKVV